MLQYLKIKNLALLAEIELDFTSGFIGVTGETGAGKSVLLGALSLLSGSRADKNLIRQGSETLEVEGIVSIHDANKLNQKLESLGLPSVDEGQLILRRSVSHNKASKIHINGTLSTLNNLQELGESWIDFHGPGEPQKLFSEEWQLKLLDLFAKQGSDLDHYKEIYQGWRTAKAELNTLKTKKALSLDEQEFLKTQIEEIDHANLSEEKIDQLERDYKRVSQAQELASIGQEIETTLDGDAGILSSLQRLVSLANDFSRIDEEGLSLNHRLDSVLLEIQDIGDSYQDLIADMDFDEEQIKSIEASMEQFLSIKRKYGSDLNLISEKRNAFALKLDSQSDIEGSIKKLEAQITSLETELAKAAEILRKNRLTAAKKLEKATEERLLKLGFKKAHFKITVNITPNFSPTGNSTCSFLFSPNVGQELMPLNKIASSGELARVMLSLKSVLAKTDQTPVLVFDEVDSNIGGEIATKVGEELSNLGKNHQVFCITHLAQVACFAQTHFVVEKDQTSDSTLVNIKSIHQSEIDRIEELARMIGNRKSKSAVDHAKELLKLNPDDE